jgi:hypothetical protein
MVITAHDVEEPSLDALAKRVGFKFWFEYEDTKQFYMVK